MTWIQPVVLEGEHVRLEPAGPEHVDGLWAAVDPELWRFWPYSIGSRDEVRKHLTALLAR